MKIRALIIEDEYKVREVFINLVEHFCPEIEIVAETDSIIEGYKLALEKKPDVVFLDIEMPTGSGFDFLLKFEVIPFETVFVTSHGHYAIRAIKFSALDYLLKPVMINDLKEIISRLHEKKGMKQNALHYTLLKDNLNSSEMEKQLVINSKTKLDHVNLSDILYFEADINYTTIYLNNSHKYFVAKTLKYYEELLCFLDSSFFFRIHKSYIVNIYAIKQVSKADPYYLTLSNGAKLDISRRRKQELQERINNK
jgi:two-component system LytT family response regulator